MTYQLKVIQQSLEQEEAEHKTTKARLADKNKIYESIEEAKSEAMKGMHFLRGFSSVILLRVDSVFNALVLKIFVYILLPHTEGETLLGKFYMHNSTFPSAIISKIEKPLKMTRSKRNYSYHDIESDRRFFWLILL